MPWVKAGKLYTIHASLDYSDPPIWRRLEIEGHRDLAEIHGILQIAFGWTNSHMHQFILPGDKEDEDRYFSDPRFQLEDAADEYACRLDEALPEDDMNLVYEYDFGDSWTVVLHVEKISASDPDMKYPRVTAGERHGPLDDSGGIDGWERILGILKNPKDKEYENIREWLGLSAGKTLEDTCDIAAINRKLQPAKRKPKKAGKKKES